MMPDAANRVSTRQVLQHSSEVVLLLCAVPPNWVSTRSPRGPAAHPPLGALPRNFQSSSWPRAATTDSATAGVRWWIM